MGGEPSDDAIEETRRFWEARTGQPVSEEDAREIIHNLAALFNLLDKWDRQTREAPSRGETQTGEDTPGEAGPPE
jgi:hypothetical protein